MSESIKKHILGRLQITRECNQNCVFCSAPPADKEMTFDEIKQKIIELKKLGTTDLMLTGGEPTLRKDLFNILDFCKTLNFEEMTIQTNGSNLNNLLLLKKIKENKNIKFNISFHSSDSEIYSKISQKPENYNNLISGIKLLGEMGISAYFTIVINKINYKQLKEHIIFIHANFPHITHFSFNFLDPIYSAKNNLWVIPTFSETQKYIHETVDYLKKNDLTFRIEKLPLCYMTGFEEFSSDIRREIFDENRIMSFLRTKNDNEKSTLNIEKKTQFHNAKACDICRLKELCPGINPNYAALFGDNEIYPIFDDPIKIIDRVKNSKQSLTKKNSIMDEAHSDLKLFEYAINHKSNKNNIYDTYSFFLMDNVGVRDEDYIINHWISHVDEIKKGIAKNLLSFYIHIPFCVSNCAYCVYPSTTIKSENELQNYHNFLINQMEKFAPIFKGVKFKTLYFGGGSPNIFSAEQMDKLFSKLFSLYEFEEYAEKAIEFNPRNTNIEKLKVIEKFEFNKFSIGVQSLSKRVLEINNRAYQTTKMIKDIVDMFNNLNLNYINIDLVIGLKGDTSEDFLSSFEEICKISPTNICIYPIKTNDDYIKKNYGNFDNFEKFYYPLFDKVIEQIIPIIKKYSYVPLFDMDKPSYVRPIIFSRNSGKRKRIDWSYAHFSIYPFSNFCLGYYSHSRVSNVIDYRYVDKNNINSMFLKKFSTNPHDYIYFVDVFSSIFEKVKFITQEFYKHRIIERKKYLEFYSKDILLEFPYAINSLKTLGIISVDDERIIFKEINEKEAYKYLLFFVGKENVLKKFPEYKLKMINKMGNI